LLATMPDWPEMCRLVGQVYCIHTALFTITPKINRKTRLQMVSFA